MDQVVSESAHLQQGEFQLQWKACEKLKKKKKKAMKSQPSFL